MFDRTKLLNIGGGVLPRSWQYSSSDDITTNGYFPAESRIQSGDKLTHVVYDRDNATYNTTSYFVDKDDDGVLSVSEIPGGGSANLKELEVDSHIYEQIIIPAPGWDGYNKVTVHKVTSAIDSNITASNIVNGVNILGVVGTASASAPKEVARYVIDENGVATVSNRNLTGAFDDITSLGEDSLKSAFSNTNVYGEISFNNCSAIRNNALSYAFSNTNISGEVSLQNCLGVNFSGLYGAFQNTNISFFNAPKMYSTTWGHCFDNTFNNCKNLRGFNLSNMQSVLQGSAETFRNAFASSGIENATFYINGAQINTFIDAFYNCKNLTYANFSEITTLSYQGAFNGTFYYCTNLTNVYFNSVSSITASDCFVNAFKGDSNLSYVNFENLYSISASGNNTFVGAFNGCSNFSQGNIFGAVNRITSSSTQQRNIFNGTFYNTGLTNMYFSNLTTLSGNAVFNKAFQYCSYLKDIYFPSFYNWNNSNLVFGSGMLQFVSNCTVHFPKSTQNSMSTWSQVASGFGGTNITVLWDLPSISNNFNDSGCYNIMSSGTIGGNTFAVGASSESADAWQAMKNSSSDLSTGWHSGVSEAPHYFDLYFPEGAQCNYIYWDIANSVDRTTNAPEFINVCVSDDGNTWKQVGSSFVMSRETSDFTEYEIHLTYPRFYKYYRLFFNSYQNNPSYITTINRLYFYLGLCRYNEE